MQSDADIILKLKYFKFVFSSSIKSIIINYNLKNNNVFFP